MLISAADGEVFPLHDIAELIKKQLGVPEIAHSQRLLHILVRVDRSDAAAGGTEFLIGKALFLEDVHHFMIRHTDGGAVADNEVLGRDLYALFPYGGNLIRKMLNVDHHAGAHHVYGLLAEDTGGQQVKNEPAPVVYYGMSGVISALIAHNDIEFFAQEVDHSALAFVAPVDSNYCSKHNPFSLYCYLILPAYQVGIISKCGSCKVAKELFGLQGSAADELIKVENRFKALLREAEPLVREKAL